MSIKLQDCIEEVEEEEEVHQNQQLGTDLLRLNHEIQIIETRVKSEVNDEEVKNSQEVEKIANNEVSTEARKEGVDNQNADEKSSDSSDDENVDVIGKRVAPLQLMGEFLKAIMEQKYSLAKKLCQMILIYEPENPEARQFLPLIEQKLLLGEKTCAQTATLPGCLYEESQAFHGKEEKEGPSLLCGVCASDAWHNVFAACHLHKWGERPVEEHGLEMCMDLRNI